MFTKFISVHVELTHVIKVQFNFNYCIVVKSIT